MKLNDLVEKYIQLRDKRAEVRKAYTDRVAKIDSLMEKIEGMLLKVFNETGMDAVKTEFGTAFKSVRSSSTVADWDVFRTYVIAKDAWELLEHRCSNAAVAQHKEANGELPPGVNWREEVVINVRRPTAK